MRHALFCYYNYYDLLWIDAVIISYRLARHNSIHISRHSTKLQFRAINTFSNGSSYISYIVMSQESHWGTYDELVFRLAKGVIKLNAHLLTLT